MRRGIVGASAILAVVALIGVRAPVASALASGSGELEGGTLRVGVEVEAPGSPPIPVDAESASLPRLVHYVATPFPSTGPGDLGPWCDASGLPVIDPTTVVFGWLFEVVGYARDGRVISDTQECVAFESPDDHTVVPSAPPFPEAPTIGDVWRAVALPRPVVGVNPVSRGVTGLDSRMWSGGGQAAQIAVTIGGFTVTGVANVVEYRLATDEGYLGASTGPGSAESPVASHRFATKGMHALSVSSVWRAKVTMTGPGGATPVPIELDVAVLSVTVDYPVVEVRSVLVG